MTSRRITSPATRSASLDMLAPPKCRCTADHYCASCSEEDAAMEAASGMTNCWVCDALAPAITDEDGNVIGTRCGCDDHPYADGSDGIWR